MGSAAKSRWAGLAIRRETLDELLAREVELLVDVVQAVGVTAWTPTSAPRMRARRIASRNSMSSAASIVIWV